MDDLEYASILDFASAGWETTIRTLWPEDFSEPFAPFHRKAWKWAESVMPEEDEVGDLITVWPRGAGKSSTAEAITAYFGVMRKRNYAWYVCSTQDSADDHVQNIGTLLTSKRVKKYFPSVAAPKVEKHGTNQGWRRNRLITQSGFIIDALGLDVTMRGRKVGNFRPDFIIFDDLDGQDDSTDLTAKKILSLSKTIIPAGQPGKLVVYGAQNLITHTGIFAQIVDKSTDLLSGSKVSGPIPAIKDLQIRDKQIVGGTATWPEGLGIEQCQKLINKIGLSAFLQECQHDVYQNEGAEWTSDLFQYADLPPSIDDFNIGVDPAMSNSPRADDSGIYVAALSGDDIFILENHSMHADSSLVKQKLLDLYETYRCEIHIEIDNGGTWLTDALTEMGIPPGHVVGEKSNNVSKKGRHKPLADKYRDGHVFHCKPFTKLEQQMTTWVPEPGAKSPDHIDACVWATEKWLKPYSGTTRGYSSTW